MKDYKILDQFNQAFNQLVKENEDLEQLNLDLEDQIFHMEMKIEALIGKLEAFDGLHPPKLPIQPHQQPIDAGIPVSKRVVLNPSPRSVVIKPKAVQPPIPKPRAKAAYSPRPSKRIWPFLNMEVGEFFF